jgi:hypothetical protein
MSQRQTNNKLCRYPFLKESNAEDILLDDSNHSECLTLFINTLKSF